tara:strand:+ start:247 stop:666 length:420 start_codon:yes stop_codon:yes gene_type:complete
MVVKAKKSAISKIYANVNNSKYFAGLVMIILNIGSKFITIKLSKSQEAYLGGKIARQLLIFSVLWMGTRDIFVSIIMTASFIALTDHIFNEKSRFCVIPQRYRVYENILDENKDGVVSDEELGRATKILEKARKNKIIS